MRRARPLCLVIWLLGAVAVAAQPDRVPSREVPPEALGAEAAGDWDEALRIYRQILAERPEQPALWLRIADVEARLEHSQAALAATEHAVRLAPAEAAVQFRLAQSRSVAGQPEQALAAAQAAVDLDPASIDYLRGRAQLATWVERYDLARDSYQRILRLRPDDRAAALGLARVEAWSGELDEAAEHYRRYTERYADDAAARLEHARAEAWRGNYPVALSLLEEYREREGATAAYEQDKARILLAAGRPNAALEILDPWLAGDPASFDLNADYTLALAASGRPGRALESLDGLGPLAEGSRRLEQVHRIVGTPMRAVVVPMVDVYGDSDGVERSQLSFEGGVSLSPRTRFDAGVYAGDLSADAGSGLEPADGPTRLSYSGLWLGLDRRLGPRVRVAGRLGGTEVDGGDDLLTYRLAAGFRLSDDFDLDLERKRRYYLVSPRALDLGIDATQTRLALSWRPNLRVHLEASAAYDSLSDGNARWQLTFEPRRSFLRREHFNLDLGVRAWWFGFDDDLGNGYYDPSRYQSYSLTGFGYWKINDDQGVSLVLSLGAFEDDGMDDFELGGSANLELTLGAYRDWMLKIRAGGTENSRVGSGAFNAWGGAIVLTRRLSGPAGSPPQSRPREPQGRGAMGVGNVAGPVDYASHFEHSHAPTGRPPEDSATPLMAAAMPAGEVRDQTGEAAGRVAMDAIGAAAAENAGSSSAILTPPAGDDAPEVEVREVARQGERMFELQLGLFHYEGNALALIEDFCRRGHDPYVVEVASSRGEIRYTVRLGPYASMEEATQMAAKMREEQGLETVIRYRSRPGQID